MKEIKFRHKLSSGEIVEAYYPEYVEKLKTKNQRFRQALKKISIQKCSCLDCKSKVFMAQQALEENEQVY